MYVHVFLRMNEVEDKSWNEHRPLSQITPQGYEKFMKIFEILMLETFFQL